MILLFFIIPYVLICAVMVLGFGIVGTPAEIGAMLALIPSFGLAVLFGWLRSRREGSRIANNRNYLFDLHMKSCRKWIDEIESEEPPDPVMVKINMAMIGHKLGDSLRVGYSTLDQGQEYNEVRERFFALQRQHGISDDEL